jgi:hypothetical protein
MHAHWNWNTLTEARRICSQFDGLGLNFLEDPFAESDIRLTHELRRGPCHSNATGEDIFGARVVFDLVNSIDILRVDATTVGDYRCNRGDQHRGSSGADCVSARLLPHPRAPCMRLPERREC